MHVLGAKSQLECVKGRGLHDVVPSVIAAIHDFLHRSSLSHGD